jgi:hypothetical protein
MSNQCSVQIFAYLPEFDSAMDGHKRQEELCKARGFGREIFLLREKGRAWLRGLSKKHNDTTIER